MPLTEKDQLFITLLRLSRGFNLYTSAHFYSVSESYIRKMFTTWIAFLYHHFKDLKEVMFPVRDAFQHLKPKVFKNFKNVRCSVDFTEFFCEVPRNYAQQGNIYSAYKYIYVSCNWNSSLENHTRLSTTFSTEWSLTQLKFAIHPRSNLVQLQYLVHFSLSNMKVYYYFINVRPY